jgi:hypothetical protein
VVPAHPPRPRRLTIRFLILGIIGAQLIDERLPWSAVPDAEIFHLFQSPQMHAQLRVAPARVLAHRAPLFFSNSMHRERS